MSYWTNQPFDVSTTNEGIKIIRTDNLIKTDKLPDGFEFKTLGTDYLDEIYNLLINHYLEDENHITRLTYSRDFLYWYLKYIPSGFIIGLIYNKKLVGMITATFLDMIIYGKEIKVPYINLLCVQSKIRKLGFGLFLINEIKSKLYKINISYAIFTGINSITKSYCITKDFIVPINYPKLKEVEFLLEDIPLLPKNNNNPLHLMVISDIDIIVTKLNKFMEKFDIRPYLTNESAYHFLVPKKNIVYSFVKKNTDGNITDFINVYKNYLYCIEKKKIISVAKISFYFYESMTLTELITNLLDKLPSYGIDQLVFNDMADNSSINITKFSTYGNLYHFFYNVSIKETLTSKLCFYPF